MTETVDYNQAAAAYREALKANDAAAVKKAKQDMRDAYHRMLTQVQARTKPA